MALLSQLFGKDLKLQSCAVSDADHVAPGGAGDHIGRIQTALLILGVRAIDSSELTEKRYGHSTSAAVLDFKRRRNVVNRSYESAPDNITGKMTIAALDRELLQKEAAIYRTQSAYCGNDPNRGAATSRFAGRLLFATAIGSSTFPGTMPMAGSAAGRNPQQDSLRKLALDRVSDATDWVQKTRADIQTVISFWPGQPVGTRDKIWRHFGMPKKFPFGGPFQSIESLLDMVLEIASVFDKVIARLGSANSLFRGADPPWFPEETTLAFTIDDDRAPNDPPQTVDWPNGSYIQPQFAPLGKKKKTEVVVHETIHSLSTHLFRDIAKPGTRDYREFDAATLLSNAYSYSTFVLDCKLNKSMPLDPDE